MIAWEAILAGAAVGAILDRIMFVRFPLSWYVFKFPAYFAHELCHYIVGLTFGGRPSLPSFDLSFSRRRIVLGSVICHRITLFNAGPIGMAPLLLWLIPSFLLKEKSNVLVFFVSVYLSPEAFPSQPDLKVAFYTGSVLVWSALAIVAYFLLSDSALFTKVVSSLSLFFRT